MKILTDSEAPTYNFDSDDEAPIENVNDVCAISEDCFAFKIIKHLGTGYYNPGDGHKIKVLYYPLENEEKITSVQTYLGKNDVLPYICELAVKSMKKDEVSVIQAHTSFSKVFKNSERKQKYDKKENFKVAFKKALRFKQKCLNTYLKYQEVNTLKKIKISATDVNILWRKYRNWEKKHKEHKAKNVEDGSNGINVSKTPEESKQAEQNETEEEKDDKLLKMSEVEALKYIFLKNEDLCTYVVYLKEFHRVDALNDDKTIIKEVIEEGEGILTPKKNDYVEFFIEEKRKKEYIHTIFDIENLKYKGLLKVLENMKKKEIAKVQLKGEHCMHSNYLAKSTDNKEIQFDDLKEINKNSNKHITQNLLNEALFAQLSTNEESEHLKNCCKYKNANGDMFKEKEKETEKHENEIPTLKNIQQEKKNMVIELIDFKRSKISYINSLIEKGKTEKMLFYIKEQEKGTHVETPIIDSECELIIKLSIKNNQKMKIGNGYLPISLYENIDIPTSTTTTTTTSSTITTTSSTNTTTTDTILVAPETSSSIISAYSSHNSGDVGIQLGTNIKKKKAYFLLSFGNCFTIPFWFYYGLKNLKEGDEVIIPLCKNQNLFSENQFIHHLAFEEFSEGAVKTGKDTSYKQVNEMKWTDEYIVQHLTNERNAGKGFFLIEDLKKKQLNTFCHFFFDLQKNVLEKNRIKEDLQNSFTFYKSFKKKMKKKEKKRKTKMAFHEGYIRKKKIKISLKSVPKGKQIGSSIINNAPKSNEKTISEENQFKIEKQVSFKKKEENKEKEEEQNASFFRKCLKKVYFDTAYRDKESMLKIKICKILCKKKDPWNMQIEEQIENLIIYKDRGNCFMRKNLLYAAFTQYKKGYDICRFSQIYKIIFEEKKSINTDTENEKTKNFLNLMEKILTNLSICSYKMEEYVDCIVYADKVLTINSTNIKSIYWKNAAYLKQNKYVQVLQNLNNSFCLKDQTLLKLYNDARLTKKKHDENFKSIFYAIYDKM